MIRINLIKGQEIFEPRTDAESAPVTLPEGEDELNTLDHLLKRNKECKKALAEVLRHRGLSSPAVDKILHMEADKERPVPATGIQVHKQIDVTQREKGIQPSNPLVPMAPFLENAWLRMTEKEA